MSELRFSNVRVNGITLHLAEAGPDDGPLLFLLHGFPEYWRAWKDYILPFAAAGFHVIAPDQRGYNLSEKPKDIAAYDLDQLAADISALPIVGARGAFRLSVTIGAERSRSTSVTTTVSSSSGLLKYWSAAAATP